MTFTEQESAAAYVDLVRYVYEALQLEGDMTPRNRRINFLLSHFVRETMRPRSPDEIHAIITDVAVMRIAPHLRVLLSAAEYQMECFVADAITGAICSEDTHYTSFDNFIYMANYEALVDQELAALGWPLKQPALQPDGQSVAFVGAGPLPISAILLSQRTGWPITCIDCDPEACARGRALIRRLAATHPAMADLQERVQFVCADGAAHDYVTHPVVFIASLVPDKESVLFRISDSSNTGSTVVVRSSEGLGVLLYEPYVCRGGEEDFNRYLVGRTQSDLKAINTSIVLRLPSGKIKNRNKPQVEKADDLQCLKPKARAMRRTDPLVVPI